MGCNTGNILSPLDLKGSGYLESSSQQHKESSQAAKP